MDLRQHAAGQWGRERAKWDGKLNGQLDEVSLYNRALTTTEINAIYAAGAAGKCKP